MLVLGLLLVKGLVVTGATGVVPGVLWAVAPLLIAGGVEGVRAGWQVFREPWVLRIRGITVEGELQGAHWYEGGKQYYYAYVDSHGVRRECKSSDGGAERTEITYDPANPDTAMIGRRATGWLAFARHCGCTGNSATVSRNPKYSPTWATPTTPPARTRKPATAGSAP